MGDTAAGHRAARGSSSPLTPRGVTAGSLWGLTVCGYGRGWFTSTTTSMACQEPPPLMPGQDPAGGLSCETAQMQEPREGRSGGSPVETPPSGCTESGAQHSPLGHPGSTSAAPHLPGPWQPAPSNPTAGRGQPGQVIRGTAALISGQNSRITAHQGCLERGNMVSVPAASNRRQ